MNDAYHDKTLSIYKCNVIESFVLTKSFKYHNNDALKMVF